jgi:hypothetical protein
MKRLSAVAVLLLGASSLVRAQNDKPAPITNDNVAMEFSQTSASTQLALTRSDLTAPFFVPSSPSNFSNSFGSTALSIPVALDGFAPQPPAEPAALPEPALRFPKYDPTQRHTQWQIGLGFAFVRFRSSVYSASAVGLNSWLSYSINNRISIEGMATAAFAPTIFLHEHVKYAGYAGGPKFTFGHDQFEPWVHVLLGGMHILPQTALGGQNGFEIVAGAGIDYNIATQWAVRLEADWVNTRVFGQSQNNGLAALGIVYHF